MESDLGRLAAWHEASAIKDLGDLGQEAMLETSTLPPVRKRSALEPPLFSLILCAGPDDRALVEATFRALAANDLSQTEVIFAVPPDWIDDADRIPRATGAQHETIVLAHRGATLAAVQQAALAETSGVFIGFLSPGDMPAPAALAVLSALDASDPPADLIYTDEEWLDGHGRRCKPRFKSAWDPDAQLGRDMFGRLCLLRRTRVLAVGGLQASSAPAQQYDLASRVAFSSPASAIRHLPMILCRRTVPTVAEMTAARQRLDDYYATARSIARGLANRYFGSDVKVSPGPSADFVNRVHWPLPDPPPLVSILIPTRDRADLLRACLAGVLDRTAYRAFEVLVLDNDSSERETHRLFKDLATDARIRIVPSPGPFNFSRINNEGVRRSRGSILLFLNSDTEVIGEDWLDELVAHASRAEVGCVGPRLLYADRSIQHAGVVLKPGPLAMHVFRRQGEGELGYDAQLAGVRGYQAVTAACLAIRRFVFDRAGGFDETDLQVSFQDIDLSLRVRALGYRNLCTPFEPVLHLEGASRNNGAPDPEQADRERRDLACLVERWSDRFDADPFGHPRVDLNWELGEQVVPLPASASALDLTR